MTTTETTPRYDTWEGFADILDLEDLHEMIAARHAAGYKRGERLQEWVYRGRFLFDTCGNFGIATRDRFSTIAAERFPGVPPVLTAAEYLAFLRQHGDTNGTAWAHCRGIACPGETCSECGFGWVLENCHDYTRDRETLRSWHPHCQASVIAQQAENDFRRAFLDAGFPPGSVVLVPTPNEYGSQEYRGPWFLAETPWGVVKIGWRKRVVSIDWSALQHDLLDLFTDVQDTKGPHYIHAWTLPQVTEYLRRIHRALAG